MVSAVVLLGDGEARKRQAFGVCTDFVKDRLKAPATASFPDYSEDERHVTVIGSEEGPYTVQSSVDSENSFGAKVRTDFTCTVTHVSGDRWRLEDLVLRSG